MRVGESPWVVAVREAQRLRVRVVVTGHALAGMDRCDARLLRHAPAREGRMVLLVWAGLDADEAVDASLRALAAISQRAWRACHERRMGA